MKKNKWVKDFPMLKNNIVYLDSAALVLKPQSVIDAITHFYTNVSISNRTQDSLLGIEVNQKIENTRKKVANLLSCQPEEVIFTSGATDSLNYSSLLLDKMLKKGDEIILSALNHSSNIIPWIELAKKRKLKLIVSLDILKDISENTKLVCLAQVNNSFKSKEDIDSIYKRTQEVGALLVNDAAQAITSEKVGFHNSDVIVFSTNKFYGPTGLGILAIKNKILVKCEPKRFGGGAINGITIKNEVINKDSVAKHEPGTMNLAGIFGFDAALNYFNSLNLEEINHHICELSIYLFEELAKIDDVRIASKRGDSIILFYVKDIEAQDVSSYLGHHNIYVRSGAFCNPYLKKIHNKNYIRISLSFYNTYEDINKLCEVIKNGGDFLGFL